MQPVSSILKTLERVGKMSYKKVLVAFDGSEGSVDALRHAMQYVKQNESELTVIHVVDVDQQLSAASANFITSGAIPASIKPETQENEWIRDEKKEAIEKGEQILSEAKTAFNKENIQANTDVLEGDPPKKICEYAKVNEMDLIVIGNRGLRGLKKWVQGSVSQKVTQHATCPVLVVK
jgi:nucleotide-binding universal stress UspA family protein